MLCPCGRACAGGVGRCEAAGIVGRLTQRAGTVDRKVVNEKTRESRVAAARENGQPIGAVYQHQQQAKVFDRVPHCCCNPFSRRCLFVLATRERLALSVHDWVRAL